MAVGKTDARFHPSPTTQPASPSVIGLPKNTVNVSTNDLNDLYVVESMGHMPSADNPEQMVEVWVVRQKEHELSPSTP